MIVLFSIVLIYLIIGVGFTIYFLLEWVEKIDESAKGTDWKFKLIIAPGCILLWPVLLKKILMV